MTEPNNFVELFIDSSGIVSWRFFSAKANFDVVEWDSSGQGENSNAQEAATLLAGFWCPAILRFILLKI